MIRNGEYFKEMSKVEEFFKMLGYIAAVMGGAIVTILAWVSLPIM